MGASILPYKEWTQEEQERLKLYAGKYKAKDLEQFFPGRTWRAIQANYINKKIYNRYSNSLYNYNISFWSSFNPINSYYAGFAAADAHIPTKRKELIFILNPKDYLLLYKLKQLTNYTGPISFYKRKFPYKDEFQYFCKLKFSCMHWREDLINNFSLIPQKTFRLTGPSFNNEYLDFCYIIGFIDGDGAIFNHQKNKNSVTFTITSGAEKLLQWIKEKIDNKFNLEYRSIWTKCGNGRIYNKKGRTYNYVSSSSIRSSVIINYFRQFPIPKLARKWDQPEVLQKIEYYKGKYPQYFIDLEIPEKWKNYKYENIQPYDYITDTNGFFKEQHYKLF